jgi:hypothetical protein
MYRTSDGAKTLIFRHVRAYVWVSVNWQRTASEVDKLTKEIPTIGDIPRDSLIAQMVSLSVRPAEVATVFERDLPLCGRIVVVLPVVLVVMPDTFDIAREPMMSSEQAASQSDGTNASTKRKNGEREVEDEDDKQASQARKAIGKVSRE